MNGVLTQLRKVAYYDCDVSGLMGLAGAFRLLSELGAAHAEELGVGYEALRGTESFWALSKMAMDFRRKPEYGEEIRVSTWPKGVDRLFALRDYRFTSASGEVLLEARSHWLALPLAGGRPKRIESLAVAFPDNSSLPDPELADLAGAAESLRASANPLETSRAAAFSDLDSNGHVNNARYVEWALDALGVLDVGIEGAAALSLARIDYALAVKPAERCSLEVRGDGAGGFLVEGRKEGQRSFSFYGRA
jgi:medium-chain acyl-[acyl-carrier-protein] hydrolase